MKIMSMKKKIINAFTIPNTSPLNSKIAPRALNKRGAAIFMSGVAGVVFADEGLKAHNRNKLGRIGYEEGPARMIRPHTTKAVSAMMNASQGNYQAFADMANETVKSNHNIVGNLLDDYGANPQLISALYNMGGR